MSKKKSPLKTMVPQVRLIPGAVSDLFAQASISGKVTVADRYGLLAAVLEDELSEDERMSIDRILYALNRGRVKVVDEISCVSFGTKREYTYF